MNLVAAEVAGHVAPRSRPADRAGGALSEARRRLDGSRLSTRLRLSHSRWRRRSRADQTPGGSRATPAGPRGARPARNLRNRAARRADRRRASALGDPAGSVVRLRPRRARYWRSSMMEKPLNNRAWLMVAPVFVLVLFSALLPMMTVVNYSVQDSLGQNQFFWNGDAWFRELLDPSTEIGARFADALLRNLSFSLVALLIEVPLGIAVALTLPRGGRAVGPAAGDHCAADADPLERGRHDLADFLARRHRPVRRRVDRFGPALQRHAGRHLGVVHDRRYRRLALDAARHSTDLCGPAGHSRRLLSSGADRCREPLGDIHQYRAAEAAESSRSSSFCCASCTRS